MSLIVGEFSSISYKEETSLLISVTFKVLPRFPAKAIVLALLLFFALPNETWEFLGCSSSSSIEF